MYEAEVNWSTESIDTLPPDIRKRFTEIRDSVVARTTLPWGEHCTECAWPTCYTTCDLYTPRVDGACRQFVDGMVRIDHQEGASPYILKLRFKPWAKLWTVGNLALMPVPAANRQERLNMFVGAIGRNAPLPAPLKSRVLTKIGYRRRRSAEDAVAAQDLPDAFVIECYNPNARDITMRVTVRSSLQQEVQPYQNVVTLPPGFARHRIAFSEIAQILDMQAAFQVELVPNNCDDTVLYFGLMDFVKERSAVPVAKTPDAGAKKKKWKCIVWDLDHTLWDGVLLESGADGIHLRQGVADAIKLLDERGILHSVASKNNAEDALEVLRRHGLDEYFLHPQIGWQPKSQSIAQIAQLLNIGIDSIAFVDDQPFERAEVSAALPDVEVLDAADYRGILDRPECNVPVTTESRNRRGMYREQERRQLAQQSYQGDYLAFLRECSMEASLHPLSEENLKRVYELSQRTNQMNFSGNRYEEAQLRRYMGSDEFETFVIDCNDRFGAYGIVGFAVVEVATPRLIDLMFSCRVQGKHVEHAVLPYLLKHFGPGRGKDFYATFRRTPKNAGPGKVFEDVGFECVETDANNVSTLRFKKEAVLVDENIVKINSFVPADRSTQPSVN